MGIKLPGFLMWGQDSSGNSQPIGVTLQVDGSYAENVRALGAAGTLETRTVVFDAEADGVALSSGAVTVAAANLITLDTFTADKKRCRITYHVADGGIPYVPFVLATLNGGDDVTAAARLSVVNVSENDTGSVDTRQRILSQQANVIEYNLEGTTSTIDRIDLVGIVSNLAGTTDSLISVEVW